jgi:hypothetical protein
MRSGCLRHCTAWLTTWHRWVRNKACRVCRVIDPLSTLQPRQCHGHDGRIPQHWALDRCMHCTDGTQAMTSSPGSAALTPKEESLLAALQATADKLVTATQERAQAVPPGPDPLSALGASLPATAEHLRHQLGDVRQLGASLASSMQAAWGSALPGAGHAPATLQVVAYAAAAVGVMLLLRTQGDAGDSQANKPSAAAGNPNATQGATTTGGQWASSTIQVDVIPPGSSPPSPLESLDRDRGAAPPGASAKLPSERSTAASKQPAPPRTVTLEAEWSHTPPAGQQPPPAPQPGSSSSRYPKSRAEAPAMRPLTVTPSPEPSSRQSPTPVDASSAQTKPGGFTQVIWGAWRAVTGGNTAPSGQPAAGEATGKQLGAGAGTPPPSATFSSSASPGVSGGRGLGPPAEGTQAPPAAHRAAAEAARAGVKSRLLLVARTLGPILSVVPGGAVAQRSEADHLVGRLESIPVLSPFEVGHPPCGHHLITCACNLVLSLLPDAANAQRCMHFIS